jgi:hypothetical protein
MATSLGFEGHIAMAEAMTTTPTCCGYAPIPTPTQTTPSRHHRRRRTRPPPGRDPVGELRAALDDFELRGEPPRTLLTDAASRIPADSPLPELARARAAINQTDPQLG